MYKLNFYLKDKHGWSFDELDNMIPWEREIYATLLYQRLQKDKQAQS